MSGTSGDQKCPACGGTLYTYSDYKPVDSVSGECLDCGFSYQTEYGRMSLKAVNDRRVEFDRLPIKALRNIRKKFTKYFGILKEVK